MAEKKTKGYRTLKMNTGYRSDFLDYQKNHFFIEKEEKSDV